MKKNSPAYLEIKESIFLTYIQPFLAAIDKVIAKDDTPNRATIINETMRRFQIEVAGSFDTTLFSRKPGDYLSNINGATMPEQFKEILLSNPTLCDAYIELGRFYIGGYELAPMCNERLRCKNES